MPMMRQPSTSIQAEKFDPKERILKRECAVVVVWTLGAEKFDPKERILKQVSGTHLVVS